MPADDAERYAPEILVTPPTAQDEHDALRVGGEFTGAAYDRPAFGPAP